MSQKQYMLNISVGLFMVLGFIALAGLIVKVSGINGEMSPKVYYVKADFTDIGGLKVRAPVTIAGVKVGEVTAITLKPEQLSAQVTMALYRHQDIPYDDTSARILTQGLLGSNYISIVPGFSDDAAHPFLKNGDVIAKTQEAVILENLIGQLLFNIKK